MEKDRTLRGRTPQTERKLPQKHQKHHEENQASPAYAAVLALLEGADSALLGQLSGEALLETVGSLGNQAALAILSAQSREPVGLSAVAAILEGARVPAFSEDAPINEVTPPNAFDPVAPPDFRFLGSQPVSFQAVSDMAVEIQSL